MTETYILLIIFLISLGIVLIESSIKMGYGILMPILLLFDLDPLSMLITMLLAQLIIGLSKTIFNALRTKIEYQEDNRESIYTISRFLIFGFFGMVLGFILVVFFGRIFILWYTAIISIAMAIVLIIVENFKTSFTRKKFYFLSIVSSFNKVISGNGYGPLSSYYQVIKDGDYDKFKGLTALSESIISGLGFVLLFIFFGLEALNLEILIILAVSGIIAAPFGIQIEQRIKRKKKLKYEIAIVFLVLGILLLIDILLGF